MPGLFKSKAEQALEIEASLGALRSATNLVDEHYKAEQELMRELHSHAKTGLEYKANDPNSRVKQNQNEFGRNEISLPKGESKAVKLVKYSMIEGFAPLLWIAAGVHVAHGWHTNDVASMDSALVFVLLCFFQGGLLYFVNAKDDHFHEPYVIIEDKKYCTLRNGREENVKCSELVVGDILLNLGEENNFPWRHTIPADIRIIECTDEPPTIVDNSMIVDSGEEADTHQLRTDERQPSVKGVPPLKATNIGLRGTEIVSGHIKKALVIKVGNETHIGRTLKTMRELELKGGKSKAESETEMEFLLNVFKKAAFTCGLIAAFASYFINGTNLVASFTIFSATSIAAIPCGLTIVMTFILRVAFKRLAAHGIKVSNLSCIEKMGAVNYLVVDTYGPLTPIRRKVSDVVYIDQAHHDWVSHDNDAEYFRDAHHEPGTAALQLCVAMTMDETVRFVSQSEDVHGSRFDKRTGKELPYERVTHNAHGHTVFEVLWDTIETGRPYDGALLRFYHQQKHVWFREYEITETIEVARKQVRKKVTKYRSLHEVRSDFHSFCAFVDPVRKIEVNVAAVEPKTKRCDKVVFMRGDPREVLRRCDYAFSEAEGGAHKPLDDYERLKIMHTISKLETSGKHVKALARSPHLSYDDYSEKFHFRRPTEDESANFPMGEDASDAAWYKEGGQKAVARDKLSFVGLVAFEEPTHEVKHAVEEVKEAGVRVIMTTKNEPHPAIKVARDTGVIADDVETDLDVAEHNAWLEDHLDLKDPDQICEQLALKLDMSPEQVKEMEMYKRRDPQEVANACVIVADSIKDPDTDEFKSLEEMDDDWWDFQFHNYSELLICRCEPIHKQVLIDRLKKQHNVVAVTGNSISDMIAIKEADLSIACVGGSDSCIDAADVTLETGEFESITQMIREGRRVFDNMKKGLAFIMVSNVPQMMAYFFHAFAQIPLPFVAIYIVLIDLASNLIAAIGMSEEEAETDLMARPPRKLGRDRMVSFKTFFFAYFQLGIIEAFACAFAFLTVMSDFGYPPHILPQLGANENWGRFPLYCKFNRGQYVNTKGEIDVERNPTYEAPSKEYPLWDEGDGGYVEQCVHPPKIFAGEEGFPESPFTSEVFDKLVAASYTKATFGKDQLVVEVIDALEASNYYEYIPWKARMSPFWDSRWLSWDIAEEVEREASEFLGFMGSKITESISTDSYLNSQPYGLWSLCLEDPELKSHRHPENSFERRHSHVKKSEDPASGYNASKVFSTGCKVGTEVWKYPMEEYAEALFCNGDLSYDLLLNDTKFLNTLSEHEREKIEYNAKACKKIAKHLHQVFYCIDECSIDCHKSPFDKRLNQTLQGVEIKQCFSVASRWAQMETIYTARTAAFIAIVICQIAAALSIKTRWMSIQVHGFGSNTLQLGMFTSLLIVAWMQYSEMVSEVIQTRPLRLMHWFPGIPWAIVLFVYDEVRKFLMRNTSRKIITPTGTKRTIGWLEANLYY